jgi:hypothetical protein
MPAQGQTKRRGLFAGIAAALSALLIALMHSAVYPQHTLSPSSPPSKGTLVLDVTPPGAILKLDGKTIGPANGFHRELLPAGPHVIELSADGYVATKQTVTIVAGETLRLPVQLALIPAPPPPPTTGILALRVSPPVAALSLDGKPVGPAADFRQEVSAGPHELEISAAGYQSRRENVTVPAGGEKSMELALVKPPPPLAAPSPLDEALQKLIAGNVAFNTPEHMSVGKSQIIEAKLSVNMPPEALIAQLSEAGKKESASLSVADRMSATLSGGGAFEVSPSGPQQQLISREQATSWTWEVTAKQVGTQYLILSFDAMLTVDGKDGTRNINTFKRSIKVEVGWPQTPSEWLEWFKKLSENLSWLWMTILVPVGVWIWARLRKKARSNETPL